ncbi:MAG: helix-turn-helix domain-containing protein [Nitrospirales bacterium]
MEGFGGFLQQARKKKRLSLEEVASQTRIQQKYLEALESENFGNLPGKVFAKGFVRSYAKAIGVDEEEALQRFLDTSRNFYEQNQLEQQHQHTKVQAEHRGKFNRNLVLVLFVVLGLSLFYFLPSQQQSSETEEIPDLQAPQDQVENQFSSAPDLPEPSPEPPTSSTSLSTPSPDTDPMSSPAISPETGTTLIPQDPSLETQIKPTPLSQSANPAPVESSPGSSQPGSHLLEIEATQLTWVVVRSDNQTPNEALLQPGQRITWKASKQFLLTLGNAAGVAIRLNGETQGPFGKPGQVVRDILIKP